MIRFKSQNKLKILAFNVSGTMDYKKKFKKTLLSPPHCILGKNGISNKFIEHVYLLLKRYKIIKVKALKTMANKSNIKEIAIEVSKQSNSHLIDVRGRTFILSLEKFEKL